MLGPIGNNGVECPVYCPDKCGADEMSCYGGKDYHGCPYEDFCIPSKGGKQ